MFTTWQKALIILGISASSSLAFGDNTKKVAQETTPSAVAEPAFEVTDLPKEDEIDGQLGGPNAPALNALREKMAKSMLEQGICNESYYGEEFCKKQELKAQSYKVPESTSDVAKDVKAKP